MLPLFDMMLQAQNGNAIETMARQFGLAQEQAAKAMAALMPAFSTGLKRSAANPYDFGKLMSAMGSGNYAQYFEDVAKAFSPQGIAEGNTVLGQIFGSKDVSRAIAAQVEQLTGVGQEIVKQMLPGLATAMMGGLMKQGMGQMPAAGMWNNDAQARMIEQWMQAAGMSPKPRAPEANFFDNPFTQSFQAFFAGREQPKQAAKEANPFLVNPFMDMFSTMMSSMNPAAAPPQPEQKPETAATPEKGFSDLVNTMFDSGLEVQKNYQKSMDSIFDSYLSAMKQSSDKS